MKARRWTVGVDFGATFIKIGLVNGQGRVACEAKRSTREHATPSLFVEGLNDAVKRLTTQLGIRPAHLHGIGVGAPGLIDAQRGLVHQLVNVPSGWRNICLRALLEKQFRCPCAVDNDVNVVTLGEWRFGAGRRTRHSVYVTLGTGVGGGLVINGKLVRGASGSAGEIGHTIVRPNGPRCACGKQGCLEALIGANAIVRRARQSIRSGRSQLLTALAKRHNGVLTPELVSRAARAGDRTCREIWQKVGCDLGLGLSNAVNLLNPERIVIGGGIAKAWPHFVSSLRATIRQQAFEVPARACRIVRAQLGDRAGIVGGAVLVWEQTARGEP